MIATAAAADIDRSHAAIWKEARNNHGLINKYRQIDPNHHHWEDAFTEWPHAVVKVTVDRAHSWSRLWSWQRVERDPEMHIHSSV